MNKEQAEYLEKVLIYITENRDKHDQDRWIGRIPSKSVVYTLAVEKDNTGCYDCTCDEISHRMVQVYDVAKEGFCGTTACLAGWGALLAGWKPSSRVDMVFKDGVIDSVGNVGAEVFGLNEEQSDEMFFHDQTLSGLWHLAHEYSEGQIQVPEQFR